MGNKGDIATTKIAIWVQKDATVNPLNANNINHSPRISLGEF